MKRQGMWVWGAGLVVMLGSACKREAAETAAPAADPAEVAVTEQVPAGTPDLRDVIETNPRYVVGISYPPALASHPGLAREVTAYGEAAKGELLRAVEALGNDAPRAPYELSLSFEITADSPQVVAVSGDGSRYTGGAHGEPLLARFVWLPERQQLLTAQSLVPSAAGWQAISAYVAGQLREKALARAEADHLPPDQEQALVRNADKMIAEGTAPEASNFALFQPLLRNGRISALRFVFPPYQVGPYSDGTQSVDVPAAVLRPHLAAEFAGLFEPG